MEHPRLTSRRNPAVKAAAALAGAGRAGREAGALLGGGARPVRDAAPCGGDIEGRC